VVVQRGVRHGPVEAQAAGHAQVQQQQAAIQVQQQVLAAPAHAQHRAAHQRADRAPERPAQRLAQAHRLDAAPAMRSAKLRRVTSTSGSSGIGLQVGEKAWIMMVR
jgi:sRNA-binding protein